MSDHSGKFEIVEKFSKHLPAPSAVRPNRKGTVITTRATIRCMDFDHRFDDKPGLGNRLQMACPNCGNTGTLPLD